MAAGVTDRFWGWRANDTLGSEERLPAITVRASLVFLDTCLAVGVGETCRVANQAAGFDVLADIVNRRNGMARRQRDKRSTLTGEERTAGDHQRHQQVQGNHRE